VASPNLRSGRAARQREAPLGPPPGPPPGPKESVSSSSLRSSSGSAAARGRSPIPEAAQLLWFTATLSAVIFLIGLGVWWSTPCGRGGAQRKLEVEEPLGAAQLCQCMALGCAASLAATFGQAAVPSVWVPVLGLLADSVAHTALLLRILSSFVDAQHASALLGYGRGVTRWSVWFDAKANADALAAAATWCCLCFTMLIFALVSLGGLGLVSSADAVRIQWHVVLSFLVLVLRALLGGPGGAAAPRSDPPWLALALNAAAGAGELSGGGLLALAFAAAVLLLEACTARAFADARPPAQPLDDEFPLPSRSEAFEQHLHRERRLGLLYCWQELLACERAWKREEREELWSTWTAQFAVPGAPFAVRGLADLVRPGSSSPSRGEDWGGAGTPPGGIATARAWLRGQLAAAARRFEAASVPARLPPAAWGECLARSGTCAESERSTAEPTEPESEEASAASEPDADAQSSSSEEGPEERPPHFQ